jgi:cell pole-organizing protein PopZ
MLVNMGDVSSEPSMEEILSSIKRIIAEEGDAAVGTRSRRPAPAQPNELSRDPSSSILDEVLELNQRVEERLKPAPMPIGPAIPSAAETARRSAADPILSDRVAEASRVPLEALSRFAVKPEAPAATTLEGAVREMLKPMLRDWLDQNLPQIVESMVAREIERITGR